MIGFNRAFGWVYKRLRRGFSPVLDSLLQWLNGGYDVVPEANDKLELIDQPEYTDVNCLEFDGSQYVRSTNVSGEGGEDISIEAEVFVSSTIAENVYILRLNGSTSLIVDIGSGNNRFYMNSRGSALNSVKFDQWQHIKVTISSTGLTTFYIDGIISNGNQASSPIASYTEIYIGSYATVLAFFIGKMRSISIDNKFQYSFSEGEGLPQDTSDNGNHATTNTATWTTSDGIESANLSAGHTPSVGNSVVGPYIDLGAETNIGAKEFRVEACHKGYLTGSAFWGIGTTNAMLMSYKATSAFNMYYGDVTRTVQDVDSEVTADTKIDTLFERVGDTLNVSVNGATASADVTGEVPDALNMFLYGASGTAFSNVCSFYSWKLWVEGVLTRDMVPISNGRMLDKVNNVVYSNDGTGTLTTNYSTALNKSDNIVNEIGRQTEHVYGSVSGRFVRIGVTEYSTIDEASVASVSGDTIIVGEGEYDVDTVSLKNGVSMKGTLSSTHDGVGGTLLIGSMTSGGNATLENFAMKAIEVENASIASSISTDGITVSNVYVDCTDYISHGFLMLGSNHRYYNCSVIDPVDHGIPLKGNGHTIENCYIEIGNTSGVIIKADGQATDSETSDYTVINNTIRQGTLPSSGIGIFLEAYTTNSTVGDGIIKYNKISGYSATEKLGFAVRSATAEDGATITCSTIDNTYIENTTWSFYAYGNSKVGATTDITGIDFREGDDTSKLFGDDGSADLNIDITRITTTDTTYFTYDIVAMPTKSIAVFDGIDDSVEYNTDEFNGVRAYAESGVAWTVSQTFATDNGVQMIGLGRGESTTLERTFMIRNASGVSSTWTPAIFINGLGTFTNLQLDDGEQHNYVVSWDGSTCKLYVDGVFRMNLNVGTDDFTNPWRLGTSSTLTAEGEVEEASVYDRALSDIEILELFENGGRLDGCVMHSDFTAYTGINEQIITDASGNGNDGTVSADLNEFWAKRYEDTVVGEGTGIKSDASGQYIDTAVPNSYISRFKCSIIVNDYSTSQVIIGMAPYGTSRSSFYIHTTGKLVIGSLTSNYYLDKVLSVGTIYDIDVDLDNDTAKIDGEVVGLIPASGLGHTSPNIQLFARINGSLSLDGEILSCELYDGSTLIRDYVPLKGGKLYDRVNDITYDNDGTGTLVTTGLVPTGEGTLVDSANYLPIAYEGGYTHNNSEVNIIQSDATMLTYPTWQNQVDYADLKTHINYTDNIFVNSDEKYVSDVLTYDLTKEFTLTEWNKLNSAGSTNDQYTPAQDVNGEWIYDSEGVLVLFPPPDDIFIVPEVGPELLGDFTFDTDLDGLIARANSTLTWDVSEQALCTITGAGGGFIMDHTLTPLLTVGETYRISVGLTGGTYLGGFKIRLGGQETELTPSITGTYTDYYVDFVAVWSNDYIELFRNAAETGTLLIDNISLKKVL